MKNTLRWTAVAAFAAASCLASSPAWAIPTSQDEVTLTVTIGNQLSVRILDAANADRTNYDFGPMTLGQTSVNTGEIDVDNNSGGLVQTYQLSVADTAGGMTLRATSGALASDEYRLSALFQDAAPAPGDFGNEDILTTSAQTAQVAGAGAVFATAATAAVQDGAAVSDNDRLTPRTAEVRLWLKLELSASGTLSGVQTDFARVSVNAT